MNNDKTLIFINYRHENCLALATTLADYFERRLGKDRFFLDSESIGYGKSITEEVLKRLEEAEILLVLIGPGWHTVVDKYNDKRLSNENDWVRREIEIAREQVGKLIIPVFNKEENFGAALEWLEKKVPSLAFMADLRHFAIRNFDSDIEALLKYISEEKRILFLPADRPPVHPSHEEVLRLELEDHFPLPAECQIPRSRVPFKGLDFFKEEDAPLFFGRTSEILKLCRAVVNFNLVLLYGQSGVGKSSLLHAGILPRLKGKWRPEYLRRDKTLGYGRQLSDLTAKYDGDFALIILDQVEEIYTDKREDWRSESEGFWDTLASALHQCPAWKFSLGFRSEHYPGIRDLLRDRQVMLAEDQELHLTPLNRQGIRDAILGATFDKKLCNLYKLRIDEELAGRFCEDLLRDGKQDAHIGPLLQYQLRRLWDDASGRRASETDWVHFTLDRYQALSQDTLDGLLDDQFQALGDNGWKEFLDKGLALDALFAYTTDMLTATRQFDRDVLERYDHIEGFSDFFDFLKNRLVLLIASGTSENPASRLAHDSLAPLIRRRFQNSDAPGQRAWRLVETKKREISLAGTFSETDIASIRDGMDGMGKIPPRVLKKLKEDEALYKKQRENRFDLAFEGAWANVQHLNYPEALSRLGIASTERIRTDMLAELATQLPFFFLETGDWEGYKNSLSLIAALDKDARVEPLLSLAGDAAACAQRLREWDPELYEKTQRRHFPQMLAIRGGAFQMGSKEGDEDEQPVHEVTVSDFLLGETPVTWWQYGLFCRQSMPNDSGFGRGDRPVINITWKDAVDYCIWLTDRQGLEQVYTWKGKEVSADWSKNGYRLPTEAEWEYAARVRGRNVRFGNGKDVADPAEMNFDAEHEYNENKPDWYVKGKRREMTTPVREFAPNGLGLYDMSGNVWEWCWDLWSEGEHHYYKASKGAKDPTGPDSGDRRVVRGGSWYNEADACRCSYRGRLAPMYRYDNVGLRVARRL